MDRWDKARDQTLAPRDTNWVHAVGHGAERHEFLMLTIAKTLNNRTQRTRSKNYNSSQTAISRQLVK